MLKVFERSLQDLKLSFDNDLSSSIFFFPMSHKFDPQFLFQVSSKAYYIVSSYNSIDMYHTCIDTRLSMSSSHKMLIFLNVNIKKNFKLQTQYIHISFKVQPTAVSSSWYYNWSRVSHHNNELKCSFHSFLSYTYLAALLRSHYDCCFLLVLKCERRMIFHLKVI